MSPKRKYNKVLASCFIISLGFHAFALGCLQRYSLWFSSPASMQPSEPLTLLDKNEVLQPTFETILTSSSKPTTRPIPETAQVALRSSIPIPEPENQIVFKSSISMPPHDFFPQSTIPRPHLPLQSSFNLLEHLS